MSNNFRLTESEINTQQETKQIKIKTALLNLHAAFVEGGKPNHVITPSEAAQVIGCKQSDLYSWLHDAYCELSFTNVLKILNLPYKGQAENTPDKFNKQTISDWFEQFYKENGFTPTLNDYNKAASTDELPDAKIFNKIMKEKITSFLKNFIAKKELLKSKK